MVQTRQRSSTVEKEKAKAARNELTQRQFAAVKAQRNTSIPRTSTSIPRTSTSIPRTSAPAQPQQIEVKLQPELQPVADNIPEDILNFSKGKSKKKVVDTEVKQARNASNFLITVNPNVSINTLDTQGRKDVYRALLSAGEGMRAEIEKNNLVKPRGLPRIGFQAPAIKKFESSVEIGSEKGFLHLHILISFDGECHIDLQPTINYFFQWLKRWREKPSEIYVNVRYYTDLAAVMVAYLAKQQREKSAAVVIA
jgi:hypothetical protein